MTIQEAQIITQAEKTQECEIKTKVLQVARHVAYRSIVSDYRPWLGCWYNICTICGSEERASIPKNEISHSENCIVKTAKDILTTLQAKDVVVQHYEAEQSINLITNKEQR